MLFTPRALALLATLTTAQLLFGCAKSEKKPVDLLVSAEAVRAPEKVSESFQVYPVLVRPDMNENRSAIAIAKGSLEKEFLFRSYVISQVPAPLGSSLKTRVVAFRKRGGKIYMLEATKGHSVSEDLPQNLVLAEFPIIEEKNDLISFDFNKGMSHLFVYGDWHASDYSGAYKAEENFATAKVRFSFLESATLSPNNALSIKQIAQVEQDNANLPVEVRYTIHPYMPTEGYKPHDKADFDRMGFFEVAPQIVNRGKELIFATRFNPKKKITFAISANTPADFREAVRDGILYWNKALGKNAIDAIDAPRGAVAPDTMLNVVQWIPNDAMGSAYADAEMDPRTGEILQAQVFLASAFAELGKLRGDIIVKSETPKITLKGFSQSHLCDQRLDKSLLQSLVAMREAGAGDTEILRAAQDYVRLVVAHEIGHTLGLRHNFAGTAESNVNFASYPNLIKKYVATGEVDADTAPSTSVMDYLVFTDSIFIGSKMRSQETKALAYDKAAVDALYFDKKLSAKEIPLFCTDSLADAEHVDCLRFDQGASPFAYAKSMLQDSEKLAAQSVLNRYISAKFSEIDEPIPLEQVELSSTNSIATAILTARNNAFRAMEGNRKLLKIRRQYLKEDESNREEIETAERAHLAADLEKNGGIAAVFAPIHDQLAEKMTTQVQTLLERRSAEFTKEEQSLILNSAQSYFKKLQSAMIEMDLKILSKDKSSGKKIPADALGGEIAKILHARAEKYVFSVSGIEGSTIQLPIFRYPLATRILAANLFDDERSKDLSWALVEQNELADKFVAAWKITTKDISAKTPLHKLPAYVAKWLLENIKVAGALGIPPQALALESKEEKSAPAPQNMQSI